MKISHAPLGIEMESLCQSRAISLIRSEIRNFLRKHLNDILLYPLPVLMDRLSNVLIIYGCNSFHLLFGQCGNLRGPHIG